MKVRVDTSDHIRRTFLPHTEQHLEHCPRRMVSSGPLRYRPCKNRVLPAKPVSQAASEFEAEFQRTE